jgi:H+-translocating NAD(P) transhydrogenase subunit alpha
MAQSSITPQQALEGAERAVHSASDATIAAKLYINELAMSLAAAGYPIGETVDPFMFRFSIFILAIFVGYYVVWSVTPALHTPLMSVTNAISSVIAVGALLAVGVDLAGQDDNAGWARTFGFIALIFASINIFGGFLVTQRMLAMYKPKERK